MKKVMAEMYQALDGEPTGTAGCTPSISPSLAFVICVTSFLRRIEMNQRFRVVWEIDIYADTAKEAAEEAWRTMQEPGSTSNYFEVFDQDGNQTSIDLDEEQQ